MRIIHGSIQCHSNTSSAIFTAACALAQDMLQKNHCTKDDIEQILFAVTDDMEDIPTSEVMKDLGLVNTPSFTVQQFRYQTGMDMCLQIMMHLKRDMPALEDVILGCPVSSKGERK